MPPSSGESPDTLPAEVEIAAEFASEPTTAISSPASESLPGANGRPSQAGVPRIDWPQALETLDGNRELLVELIDIFREECPKLRAEIETAFAAGDLPGLRRSAHTLKGALAHLAAGPARELAQQVEDYARQQNLASASALWPQLQSELDQLNPVLDEFTKQPC
jgi:HPt (histidine-containing phosphotransfer) domain-containing protein